MLPNIYLVLFHCEPPYFFEGSCIFVQNKSSKVQKIFEKKIGPNFKNVGPNYRKLGPNSDKVGPNSQKVGPNSIKVGPNYIKDGPNYNESWSQLPRGARGGNRNLVTEGVKIEVQNFSIMRSYSQLHVLSALKKRRKWGLPL